MDLVRCLSSPVSTRKSIPDGGGRQTTNESSNEAHKNHHYPIHHAETALFHCPKCLGIFQDRESRRKHVKKMKCEILICRLDHDHELVDLKFSTMTEALQWKNDQELDRAFSIRTSGPKRKIFQCCQNRVGNSTKKAKKSKKSIDCSANFSMKETTLCSCDNHESDRCVTSEVVVQVKGCLRHSHILERRNLRLSKLTKDRVADLLKSGLRSDVVLAKYCDPTNKDPASKKDHSSRPKNE